MLCGNAVWEIHPLGHQLLRQVAEVPGLGQRETGGIVEECEMGNLVANAPSLCRCRQRPVLGRQTIEILGKPV